MKEIDDDLTYKIIGCAMKEHSTLKTRLLINFGSTSLQTKRLFKKH
jgi:hypothetical protein